MYRSMTAAALALLIAAAPPARAGDTYKFNPPLSGPNAYHGLWHDADVWLIENPPGSGQFEPAKDWPNGDDHIIIETPIETPAKFCEVVVDDAGCRTMTSGHEGAVRVIGQRFTLGDPWADTASTLNGRIEMYQNGLAQAYLAIYNKVTLGISLISGDSMVTGSSFYEGITQRYPNAVPRGTVHGAYGPDTIFVRDGVNLDGNLELYLNIEVDWTWTPTNIHGFAERWTGG